MYLPLGYVADAATYCEDCACKRYGDVDDAFDNEGNSVTPFYEFNHEGFAACDSCGVVLNEEDYGGHDPELVNELVSHLGGDTAEAIKYLEEHYAGAYPSVEDWAEQLLVDTGGMTLEDRLRPYFNYKAYARDRELGGDIFTIKQGEDIHIFWNN